MVFYATFNNISAKSWRLVLLVEETGVPGRNHQPVASHRQTLLHNVGTSTLHHERGSNSQLYWVFVKDYQLISYLSCMNNTQLENP